MTQMIANPWQQQCFHMHVDENFAFFRFNFIYYKLFKVSYAYFQEIFYIILISILIIQSSNQLMINTSVYSLYSVLAKYGIFGRVLVWTPNAYAVI